MRHLTDKQCTAILARHGIEATPVLLAALRDAYQLGLNTDVMKTKTKEKK